MVCWQNFDKAWCQDIHRILNDRIVHMPRSWVWMAGVLSQKALSESGTQLYTQTKEVVPGLKLYIFTQIALLDFESDCIAKDGA